MQIETKITKKIIFLEKQEEEKAKGSWQKAEGGGRKAKGEGRRGEEEMR